LKVKVKTQLSRLAVATLLVASTQQASAGFFDKLHETMGAAKSTVDKGFGKANNEVTAAAGAVEEAHNTASATKSQFENGINLQKQDIQQVQEMLNGLGYDAGPADGVMGQKTMNAILEFQKAQNLTTSAVDSTLIQQLEFATQLVSQ
jgi:peptidoglycan hydrolase-like protein with peptidoglycan-binding domain